eukprot:GHVN01029768.1.p1 GENE.GHVN01029768.1~~GHVN01029768.1.p1  ORF type:complete len:704 (+),score=105.99 GHVN01029768.1:156-2267(+)
MGLNVSRSGYYQINSPTYRQLAGGHRYIGALSINNKPHGSGVILYTNGNAFVGSFNHGLRHGTGIFMDDNSGDLYIGQWANDACDGTGCLTHQDGSYYKGLWWRGSPHGTGERGNSKGLVLESEHSMGQLVSSRLIKAIPSEEATQSSETDSDPSDGGSQCEKDGEFQGDTNPEKWTPHKVCKWLDTMGLGSHVQAFDRHGVTGSDLLNLTHHTLRDSLKIVPFGQRAQILQTVRQLHATNSGTSKEDAIKLLFGEPEGRGASQPHHPNAHKPSSQHRCHLTDLCIPFEQLMFIEQIGGPSQFFSSSKSYFKAKYLGKEVAVKVYVGALVDAEAWVDHLELLCGLRHPNLALFLGYSCRPPFYCIVMEYVVNRSLDVLLHGNSSSNMNLKKSNDRAHRCTHSIGFHNIKNHQIESALTSPKRRNNTSYPDRQDISQKKDGLSTSRNSADYAHIQMPLQWIHKIARDIALGCSYLAEKGIGHLNLKPSNVLLDETYTAKLTDPNLGALSNIFKPVSLWNIERWLIPIPALSTASDCESETMQGDDMILRGSNFPSHSEGNTSIIECRSCGTPVPSNSIRMTPTAQQLRAINWCAPEVLREATYFASHPVSDVFSFGLILWEMLSGKVPFQDFSQSQIKCAVGFFGLQPAELVAPTPIKSLISSCLGMTPEERPSFPHVISYISASFETASAGAETELLRFMDGV